MRTNANLRDFQEIFRGQCSRRTRQGFLETTRTFNSLSTRSLLRSVAINHWPKCGRIARSGVQGQRAELRSSRPPVHEHPLSEPYPQRVRSHVQHLRPHERSERRTAASGTDGLGVVGSGQRRAKDFVVRGQSEVRIRALLVANWGGGGQLRRAKFITSEMRIFSRFFVEINDKFNKRFGGLFSDKFPFFGTIFYNYYLATFYLTNFNFNNV